MGDFNYKGIDWAAHSCTAEVTKEAEAFFECVEGNFFTQHVKVPTRGLSTLELVLTSQPEIISELEVINCLENSDHNMLIF